MTHPTIRETIELAKSLHASQLDKSGKPYWLHLIRVAARLRASAPADAYHAALLHDVLEDTQTTADDLRKMGYSERVLELVEGMTKRESGPDSYVNYIDGVIASGDQALIEIKIADTADNMSPRRMATPQLRGMRPRYENALAMLTAAHPTHGVQLGDLPDAYYDPMTALRVASFAGGGD